MSSLSDDEKRYFEKIFNMDNGYVLDFSDTKLGEFFKKHQIDIHGSKYQTYGKSKAKKLRAFWKSEPDKLVGRVLIDMLRSYEVACELDDGRALDRELLEKSRTIAKRLSGQSTFPHNVVSEGEFMSYNYAMPDFQKLPIDAQIVSIIESRFKEAKVVFKAGAHLSVAFLCGSVLEVVLLGTANSNPAKFNQAKATPKKKDGTPKIFPDWTLAQLTDVACEVGAIKLDIKKFSHGLREFRNYIHPYEQLTSSFNPDKHTSNLCIQVLNAALADLAGERT